MLDNRLLVVMGGGLETGDIIDYSLSANDVQWKS